MSLIKYLCYVQYTVFAVGYGELQDPLKIRLPKDVRARGVQFFQKWDVLRRPRPVRIQFSYSNFLEYVLDGVRFMVGNRETMAKADTEDR